MHPENSVSQRYLIVLRENQSINKGNSSSMIQLRPFYLMVLFFTQNFVIFHNFCLVEFFFRFFISLFCWRQITSLSTGGLELFAVLMVQEYSCYPGRWDGSWWGIFSTFPGFICKFYLFIYLSQLCIMQGKQYRALHSLLLSSKKIYLPI